MKTAYVLLSLAWLIYQPGAWAGGGYGTPVKVSAFQTRGSLSEIVLEAISGKTIEGQKCQRISLQVEHSRVPWYSFMPLMGSSHPSYGETQTALAYLQKAQQSKQSVQLISMSGLGPTAAPCTFASKGLSLQQQGAGALVITRFHPL